MANISPHTPQPGFSPQVQDHGKNQWMRCKKVDLVFGTKTDN